MKSKVIAFLLPFFTLLPATSAFATSFSLTMTGDSTFSGDEIALYLNLASSANAGGSCGGVCGIIAGLSYDTSKLQLISITPAQGFDLMRGSTLVLSKTTGASDGVVMTLRFQKLAMNDGESTTVALTNMTGSNGDTDIYAGNASRTVTYQAPREPAAPSSNPSPNPEPNPSPNPAPAETPSENSNSSVAASNLTDAASQNNSEQNSANGNTAGEGATEEEILTDEMDSEDDFRMVAPKGEQSSYGKTTNTAKTENAPSYSGPNILAIILVLVLLVGVSVGVFFLLKKRKSQQVVEKHGF